MDDIVVCRYTEDDHDSRLDIVLKELSSAGITLTKEKCSFKQSEISFLGQIIGANGICADPQKVQAIIDLPQPQDVSKMRCVLGMVNQLRKFIPDLATVTDPLRALLKDKAAWLWGPAQDTAFSKLKTLLTSNKLSNCATHLCVLRSRLTAHPADLVLFSLKNLRIVPGILLHTLRDLCPRQKSGMCR